MPESPQGPRIYNLFPTLLGPIPQWERHLPAIADMGFNWIFVNPFHAPGDSGSLYAIKDYYRLHPLLRGNSRKSADALLKHFTAAAADAGLEVIMDLVINHTAKDSPLVKQHPDWYAHDDTGQVRSPYAVDLDDPNKITVWEDLAELDYGERPARREMLDYWDALAAHYAKLGFRGFRCDAAYKVPGAAWQELIASARKVTPDATFFAETLGAGLHEVDQLRPAGFDYFFNSAKWWDFRAGWLLDQYEQFRHLAPSIAFPETHDTTRLAADSNGDAQTSRFWYLFAALFSSGVMMPVGYELGFKRALHVVETSPEDWEEPSFDISAWVRAVNAMKADTPVLNQEGPQQRFTGADEPVVGLLRRSKDGPQRSAALINPSPDSRQAFDRNRLAEVLGTNGDGLREITPRDSTSPHPGTEDDGSQLGIPPQGIRVFTAE